MAGGLGFLGAAHFSLVVFPLCFSIIIAAELAFRAVFDGLTLASLQAMLPLLVGYLLFVEIVVFGPLIVFIPVLAEARRDALRRYGTLVQQHNAMFHAKWIEGRVANGEPLLGHPDMSSLADIGSSYAVVRDMRVVPVTRAGVLRVAVTACLPGGPVALLTLPTRELVELLLGVAK